MRCLDLDDTSVEQRRHMTAQHLDSDALHFQLEPLCVCSTCGRLHGEIVSEIAGASRPGQRQHCDCRDSNESEPWPDYDFPEAVTLCRCCGLQPLLSGSRWSMWFCRGCRRAIQGINRDCRGPVIPIGRFTLLEQIGRDEDDDADPMFVAESGDWFARVERLERHARDVVQSNLRRLNVPAAAASPLVDYLGRLPATVEVRQAAVLDLGRAFAVPPIFLLDAVNDLA